MLFQADEQLFDYWSSSTSYETNNFMFSFLLSHKTLTCCKLYASHEQSNTCLAMLFRYLKFRHAVNMFQRVPFYKQNFKQYRVRRRSKHTTKKYKYPVV